MAINIFKRIIIILAIYIIIIFGILFLQFTNDSGFFLSIDGLKISGSEKTNGQTGAKTPELPVFISASGINFFIDNENPLTAVTEDGSFFVAEPESFIKEENSFAIKFNRGISLTFFPAEVNSNGENNKKDSAGVIISAEIPEGISEIRLKYNLATGVRFETMSNVLMLRVEKNLFSLSGAAFDTGKNGENPPVTSYLSIRKDNPLVVYQKYEPRQETTIAEIATDPAASEDSYLKATQIFYNEVSSLYKAASSAGSLSEQLLAAYVSESGKAGTYQQTVNSIPASFVSGTNRSYLTSVYINNLESNWEKRRESNAGELNAYNKNLSEGNPAVFEKKALVSFLIENKKTADIPALTELAVKSAGTEAITARQAAGILEFYTDRDSAGQSNETIGNDIIILCEEKIRENLQYVKYSDKNGGALYLTNGSKTVDTRLMLETASILYRYGDKNSGKADWKAVGRFLTVTILDMAADRNTVPKSFDISESQRDSSAGSGGSSDGTMSLGEIYPLVEPLQTWYPHMVSINPYCVWTCALSVNIVSTEGNVIDITARFPAGSTHYMIVTGIPRFNRIQIYGIDFRTDPRFETYNSSGYRYHPETGTLFLKMRHKSEYETVRLFTGDAAPAQQQQAQEEPQSGGN